MPTIYATAPTSTASDLADALVTEELAACVNLVQCNSVYRWDDDVHRDEEVILLAKTTPAAADRLMARLEAIHPYDVPCIERFDESSVTDPFAEWLLDATA